MSDVDDIDDELAALMATLTVRDEMRSKKTMAMPSPELVLEFNNLVCAIMKREKKGRSEKVRIKRIVSHFGAPPIVMAKLWELLIEFDAVADDGAKKVHLLWALYYLKEYSSEAVACTVIELAH